MVVAVERDRVFKLKNFKQRKDEAEELAKANAAPVFNTNIAQREDTPPESDSEESPDESALVPAKQPTKQKKDEG